MCVCAGLFATDTSGLIAPVFAEDGRAVDSESSQAQRLYQRAWTLIKDLYYDPKFNGQQWESWKEKYNGKLKSRADAEAAIKAMVHSLGNPRTRLWDDALEKWINQTYPTDIAMKIGLNEEGEIVILDLGDSPAALKSGLEYGDQIIEVDGKSVKGQSIDQVMKQVKGEKDTTVSITIMRGDKRSTGLLLREDTPFRSITNSQILPGGIGYLRLRTFISKNTNADLKAAIKALETNSEKRESASSVIIDLRDNPGGLLSTVVDAANMFVDDGVLVNAIDADGDRTAQVATKSSEKIRLPIVLLMNKRTGSGSEVFCAALKDNGRAKLVGQTSCGNAWISNMNPLGNGLLLEITAARFVTPKLFNFSGVGIAPDFLVNLTKGDYEAGKGPWWSNKTKPISSRSPLDGMDIQLSKAIEVSKP